MLEPTLEGRMKRRALLRATAALGVGGLAGCLGLDPGAYLGGSEPTATGRDGPGRSENDSYPALAENGFPSTVCEESTQPWALLEIDGPAFGDDWPSDADARYGDDGRLGSDQVVIGVTDGDRPRAYPVSILWYHEVVEDEYAGDPLLVTYCSICRSGMVASREVAGEVRTFRASGLLWQPESVFTVAAENDNRSFGATTNDTDVGVRNSGNLVLVDQESGSYWSQLLARAICGPLENEALSIRPSSVARWGDWRREHPDTDVLLPPPYSGLDRTGEERRE
jgi:hypothetical protein